MYKMVSYRYAKTENKPRNVHQPHITSHPPPVVKTQSIYSNHQHYRNKLKPQAPSPRN